MIIQNLLLKEIFEKQIDISISKQVQLIFQVGKAQQISRKLKYGIVDLFYNIQEIQIQKQMERPRIYNIFLSQSQQKTALRDQQTKQKHFMNNNTKKQNDQYNDLPSTFQSIKLQKGSSFWNLDSDFQTIYKNFNLLSYFSNSWQIEILERYCGNSNSSYISKEKFKFRNFQSTYCLIQKYKDKFIAYEDQDKNKPQQLKINYYIVQISQELQFKQIQINSQQKKQQFWRVNVQISWQKIFLNQKEADYPLNHIRNGKQIIESFQQYIKIKIIDQDNWITEKSKLINVRSHHHRISDLRKSMLNEIEYFYIEAKDQRYKKFQGQHISLAIQGGGSKGVAYVGAFEALRKNKPTTPITSIIGSSIGAIYGLAFCCHIPTEVIMRITANAPRNMSASQKYPQKDQQFLDYHFNSVMNFLKDFNIVQDKIISILKSLLTDQKFKSLLLKMIYLSVDQQVYQMFTCKSNKQTLNLTGLIKGELISGKTTRQFVGQFIKYFVSNNPDNNLDFDRKIKAIHEKYQTRDSQIISERLTMMDLYLLTGIQFTIVAVELDHRVLRFFNQKTTPDLPVIYALQISSSIPIAFEAPVWKQQWGKYYIHYENIRKQINLTGCKFTDGSILSNFPMKFWDNQDMRPMYFSHAKTKQTIMYGWGVIDQKQKQNDHKEKTKEMSRTIRKLSNLIMKKIGIKVPMFSWISEKISCSKPKQKKILLKQNFKPFEAITKIPFISTIINMFETWYETKDNLNAQCFSHSSYQTMLEWSYINQIKRRPNQKQVLQQINQILQSLKNIFSIKENLNQKDNSQIYKKIKQNIEIILNKPKQYIPKEEQLYEYSKMLTYVISTFLDQLEQFFKKGNFLQSSKQSFIYKLQEIIKTKMSAKYIQNSENKNISCIFITLDKIKKERIFVLCDLKEDFDALRQVSTIFLEFLKEAEIIKIQDLINKKQSCILNQILQNVKEYEQNLAIKIINNLQEYSNNKKLQLYPNQQSKEQINSSLNNKIMILLSKLQRLTFTNSFADIKKMMNKMKYSILPQFFISCETNSNRTLLRSYILKNIIKFFSKQNEEQQIQQQSLNEKEAGIHIVLESISLSELYFHEYCLIVKDTILQYNQGIKALQQNNLSESTKHFIFTQQNNLRPVKITTITTTGYHSLVMFLHACDLSDKRIGEQVWKIRDLIRVNKQQINQKFQRADWTKMTPIMLRELQKEAIENKKDIFKYIQEDILKARCEDGDENKNFSSLKQRIQKQVYEAKISNDDIISSMEASLNYVAQLLSEMDKRQEDQQYTGFLMKKLILNTSQVKYEDRVIENSENFKNMTNYFFEKYKQVFQYIVYEMPGTINKVINYLRPEQRGEAWKGIILSQILSGRPIKRYVHSILKQLKLKPQITLKQFYDSSSKKIQMNFSVIQDNIVAIYNHKVRPNMPVWAAIKAASSIPEFFAPVLDRTQWQHKQQQDYEKRKVKKHFMRPPKQYQFIVSSQILTRLPLDLLRNNKYIKKITDRKKQIFLIFNFSQVKLPSMTNQIIKQMNITPLTLGELISKFVSFRQILLFKMFGIKLSDTQQKQNVRAMSILSKLPSLQNKKKQLKSFLVSQDNLIRNLYPQQISIFPAKLGTLDFGSLSIKDSFGQRHLAEFSLLSMLLSYYILKQKLNNKYKASIQKFKLKRSHSIISSLSQNNLNTKQINKTDERQRSERRIYFRVESIEYQQQSQNSQMQKNEQIKQKYGNKLSRMSSQSKMNDDLLNSQSNLVRIQQMEFQKQKNYLLIRFISILNFALTGALHEKYFIYYKHDGQYKKIKKQKLAISEAQHNILYLKIQYPSSDLSKVKCREFELNFKQLFKLKRQSLQKFGYVYQLHFDNLYGQVSEVAKKEDGKGNKLNVFNIYEGKPIKQNKLTSEQDLFSYMMNENGVKNCSPKIEIKTILSNIAQRSTLCDDCVVGLQVKINQKETKLYNSKRSTKRRYLECPCCNRKYDICDKFHVKLDNKQGCIKCPLGHKIERCDKLVKKYDQLILNDCDICGKGYSDRLWEDNSCEIYICDPCRIESIQDIKQ